MKSHGGPYDASDSNDKSAGYFEWFKSASGQAFDFLGSVVKRHGPDLIDKLAPIVTDALEQALTIYMTGAAESNGGTKSKPTRKSRR